MNPIPRILQAEPGITESNRQTLAKVSDLLDLLDSAIDFSGLSAEQWVTTHCPGRPLYQEIEVDRDDIVHALTLFNQLAQ